MKMVCTKKNLNSGLAITSRVIGSGNTLPILNNILFKTEEGRLRLSSTNLEMAINTWVGGKIEEEGEITVPARLINDYVNNIVKRYRNYVSDEFLVLGPESEISKETEAAISAITSGSTFVVEDPCKDVKRVTTEGLFMSPPFQVPNSDLAELGISDSTTSKQFFCSAIDVL